VTWAELEKQCRSKKVVIYGLGLGIRQFMEKYGDSIAVDAVIDNDVGKKGKTVGELLPEAFCTKCENVRISGSDILSDYDIQGIVILVASAGRHEEILEELRSRHFCFMFVLSQLEDFMQYTSDKVSLQERQEAYAKDCLRLPVSRKKLLFVSFSNYGDHGKYIAEALVLLRYDLDIVWVVSDLDVKLPTGMRKVLRANWKKVLYEAETAVIWVSDNAMPSCFIKRPEQIYIQTKHWASITLKKFYLDAETFCGETEKLELWKRESEIIDYIIVGSEFDKESCRRGFRFDRGFIMAGSPRSDGLFREKENREKVYSYYGISENMRVAMYAPTYRFDRVKGKSVHESREIEIDYYAVRSALCERFGGNWIIALRLHPSVASATKKMEFPSFVLDVSAYEDSEELVSAFNIMISDFSSILFEPAFVGKPVFLFATDLEDYLENEYRLLLDYRGLPFPIAESTVQLCENIRTFDKRVYGQKIEQFLEYYGVHEDGHASERAAKFISDLLDSVTKILTDKGELDNKWTLTRH